MAKAFDPKAKAKRQKIVAGVLGLVLVGVLVFQAPTILGMFGGGSSSTASEPAATPPPAAPAPATPGAPAAATPALPPGGTAALVDSDPTPQPADGQLVTFDRFESKDPFVQQVGDEPAGQTAAPAPPANTATPANEPKSAAPAPKAPPATTQAAPKTARMSVNGGTRSVAVKDNFPEDDPIFTLVSLQDGVAKVSIVGGSYANGSQTISLKKGGKPVTLMNTADGTTFVLRYVG